MKLADHTEHIRKLIDTAFRNRLGRMGVSENGLLPVDTISAEYRADRKRIEIIREVFIKETGTVAEAYEKLVEELTFTLFNRLAALKVMEAHTLHPEIVTRRSQHGDRSFAHLAWLEQNSAARSTDAEGLLNFFEEQLAKLENEIPLFSPKHPYHLMPTAVELNTIINAFNQIETDTQVDTEIWKSDDVLGWLYESYNNKKKADHKASKAKTEYNKVSIQSQIYTPRWVVQFLVDNSLGKLYLEIYPNSTIKEKYKIANAPATQSRAHKPLHEVRLIDPSNGSGNFLLYAFDVFYDLYLDNINEQGNPDNYDEANIAKLIIENNLHGVDLDDRAVQLAQLGLYIKAKRKKKNIKIDHFNVVSSDFFLPVYDEVKYIFEEDIDLTEREKTIITDLWSDLQNAHKFGSLIRLEEKLSLRWFGTKVKVNENQVELFGQENEVDFENFRENFFNNLQKAVAQNTAKQGQTFLNNKTQDAITFLSILTQKYDVAVANPPYTDSADFGPELKSFIDTNYSKPYKFNSNLYATFIKRCYELIDDTGKMALLHPLTFMYISSFEDVRKFIINKSNIEIFIEFGLGGIFTSKVDVDVAAYILEKSKPKNENSFFMNLQEYKGLKIKRDIFENAYEDFLITKFNKHNYFLPQEKLKTIQSWPFIYWISDGFRSKFTHKSLVDELFIVTGLMTGNNDKFLRYRWEVNEISKDYNSDLIKWVSYQKGGEFNKWFGNNWLVVNFENNGNLLATTDNKKFYFKEGITYSATSSKGLSFRKIELNQVFDKKGSCLFLKENLDDLKLNYFLALLNSKLTSYIAKCLNNTVETQVGDVKRVPYIVPNDNTLEIISQLSNHNIQIKKELNSFRLYEIEFKTNPLKLNSLNTLIDRLNFYFNYENIQIVKILINEAIINNEILKVYDLNQEDCEQVEAKMGKSVGELPVFEKAKKAFLVEAKIENNIIINYIENLANSIDEDTNGLLVQELKVFYKSKYDLEEFCIRHQINPINVWYLFQQAQILPKVKSKEIALEFLTIAFKNLLIEDEDGIIPLVGLPDEPRLLDRLEQYCLNNGFTSSQFLQLDNLLGKPVNEYIEHYYFDDLCDFLNLFRHLPKTPFIWHLSSGKHQGFEAYIIIYKWNRDSLFKLKTQYLAHRIENLEYRLIQLQDVNTAQSQNEKETIRHQLDEIKVFNTKIDELIAEGYDPKLDDGVGKNIAPLQKKGLLRADVLKAPQLTKYLNTDW